MTMAAARRRRRGRLNCSTRSPYHYSTPAAKLREDGVIGIILSGGPQSVYSRKAPHPDREIFNLGVPMLGICYGGFWAVVAPMLAALHAVGPAQAVEHELGPVA